MPATGTVAPGKSVQFKWTDPCYRSRVGRGHGPLLHFLRRPIESERLQTRWFCLAARCDRRIPRPQVPVSSARRSAA